MRPAHLHAVRTRRRSGNAGDPEHTCTGYAHGDAGFAGSLPGASFHAVGPRGSLALAPLSGPAALFGDETRSPPRLHCATRAARVMDCRSCSSARCSRARAALADLGFSKQSVIEREPGRSHLPAIERELRAALAQHPNAHLVLTGHAQTIQAIRAVLRSGSAQPPLYAGQKVKPYWADGKRGLD